MFTYMTIKLVAYLGFTWYPFRFPYWGGVVTLKVCVHPPSNPRNQLNVTESHGLSLISTLVGASGRAERYNRITKIPKDQGQQLISHKKL